MDKQQKEARLAAALRENLRKRKAGAVPLKTEPTDSREGDER